MPLMISAEFLLGFYQGSDRRGAAEAYPSPVRLQMAFIDAAHGRSESTMLTDVELAAIIWLEDHTPDAILLPETTIADSGARSYRDKGLIAKGKVKGAVAVKKDAVDATRISAIAGPIRWWWAETPSAEVCEALASIAHDVPYLGERIAPVRLTVESGRERPSGAHERVIDRRLGDTAPSFLVPLPGRYAALQTAFETTSAAKSPSESADGVSTSEAERPSPVFADRTRSLAYSPPEPLIPDTPWPFAIRIRVQTDQDGGLWAPRAEEYVSWCVALHRTLTRFIGDDAAPLVTGRYVDVPGAPTPRPANRLAIQIIPPRFTEEDEGASFLLMIPQGADPSEVNRVRAAVQRISSIYRRRDKELSVRRSANGAIEEIDLSTFWPAPAPGTVRWWAPTPTMVAEGGPSRRREDRRWTADDAVRLAVAFVWRDALGVAQGRAAVRNASYVDAVTAQGVRTSGAWRDNDRDPKFFAHRIPEGQVITCIRSLVDLGELSNTTSLVAIGQSRHLGGGLLHPVDLPSAMLDQNGVPAWSR